MNKKRKQAQEYIISQIKLIDPDKNTQIWINMFDKMSDKKFDNFMNDLKNKKTKLYVYLPNMKKNITNEKLLDIATKLKVNLFEKIKFFDKTTGRSFLTPNKYLIINNPVRRVIQYLFHKISIPESDRKIDAVSGQVIKPDKGSRLSLIETQLLANKGFKTSIIELLKVRGGDINTYQEFKNKLESNGSMNISEIESETMPRSVIMTDVFFKCMYIDSNITQRR